MSSVYITRLASFLPNEPVSNDTIESVLGQLGERPSRARRATLRSNGINQRHYAIDPATGKFTHNNTEMTAEAVRALGDEEFAIEDLDCLVCGTTLADQLMPNHAVMVHGELGIPPREVVATSGVCVSGMTALKYAWMGVASGEFKKAVATGSEAASGIMHRNQFEGEIDIKVEALEARPELAFEKDFLRWMLSDGAGAVLLEPQPAKQGLSLRVNWVFERSYANEADACMYSGGEKLADGRLVGWKYLEHDSWIKDSVFAVKQDVKLLNSKVIEYTLERPMLELKELKGISPDDIDWFVPHYSSEYFRPRVFEGLQKIGFEIPYERWFTNLAEKGNTGAASVYIMLEELFESERLKEGQKILCYVPESGRFSTAFMLLTVVSANDSGQ
ncbi:MAG: beta-ketoacyl-ACP synthase III [Gammaproteobacteria bacterium]